MGEFNLNLYGKKPVMVEGVFVYNHTKTIYPSV